jgi:hypothetical protein
MNARRKLAPKRSVSASCIPENCVTSVPVHDRRRRRPGDVIVDEVEPVRIADGTTISSSPAVFGTVDPGRGVPTYTKSLSDLSYLKKSLKGPSSFPNDDDDLDSSSHQHKALMPLPVGMTKAKSQTILFDSPTQRAAVVVAGGAPNQRKLGAAALVGGGAVGLGALAFARLQSESVASTSTRSTVAIPDDDSSSESSDDWEDESSSDCSTSDDDPDLEKGLNGEEPKGNLGRQIAGSAVGMGAGAGFLFGGQAVLQRMMGQDDETDLANTAADAGEDFTSDQVFQAVLQHRPGLEDAAQEASRRTLDVVAVNPGGGNLTSTAAQGTTNTQ